MITERNRKAMKGFIFDLDGVLTDTAKYHYLAWKELARGLGFHFPIEQNERQKGVSRMASLEILLEAGGITDKTEAEKLALAEEKNNLYLKMIETITSADILPGISEFLERLKREGVKIALGSASKSGGMILEKLGIEKLFDAIVDGNLVSRPKPDPEVFLKAAKLLGLPPKSCIVVEDAKAGVEAALAAGSHVIGIGSREQLSAADAVLNDTWMLVDFDYERLFKKV